MPDLLTTAPDNPEFARVLELRQLRELPDLAVDIAPTDVRREAQLRDLAQADHRDAQGTTGDGERGRHDVRLRAS